MMLVMYRRPPPRRRSAPCRFPRCCSPCCCRSPPMALSAARLAAVTIFGTDLKTAAGLDQDVTIQLCIGFPRSATSDTVYAPATTVRVTDGAGAGVYGTFTVAYNGSGSLVVTATAGAAVATGN